MMLKQVTSLRWGDHFLIFKISLVFMEHCFRKAKLEYEEVAKIRRAL